MLERVGARSDLSAADAGQAAGSRRPILPMAAHGISLRDGPRLLLDRVSLTLGSGPSTVIMGPNGAGKSLLLRILHGLVRPSEGSVTWAGEPADVHVRARQAMVFQKPTLLRRSARANIAFVLRHLPHKEAATRTDDILSRARLTHVAESPARLLSGGEQQRLAIARALALDPDVLFLDEPCANLDPASTHAVEQLIEGARAGGTKIVLVTHDIGQAKRLAGEIVFMSEGRIAERAMASDFFDAPRAAAAKAYLEGRIFYSSDEPPH